MLSEQAMRAAMVLLGASIAAGCGGIELHAEVPEEGLPLLVPAAIPTPPAPPEPIPPEQEPPGPGEAQNPCPLVWTPGELHASVLHIPADIAGRWMIPLYAALCACTRPGQNLLVAARIVPGYGEITAQTRETYDRRIRPSRSIDACLARELSAVRFEPLHLGGCVMCPPGQRRKATAHTSMEPAHLATPRPANCDDGDETKLTGASITMPFYVDRRDER